MTLVPHARLVLSDAELVRARLEDERDEREWRLDWALAVVLLRIVGDVLHKVDGAADPRVGEVSRELYHSWSEGQDNAIFRDFIKRERDSIVHEYKSAMSEGPIAIVSVATALSKGASCSEDLLEDNLYRPMDLGKFAGEDGRDLIDDALEWWRVQLDEVDRRVVV